MTSKIMKVELTYEEIDFLHTVLMCFDNDRGPHRENNPEDSTYFAVNTKLNQWLKDGMDLPPCGYSEPESDYRDPDTGKHRTAKCEGGRLVVRGNGLDGYTDGQMFIGARPCPNCEKKRSA